MNKTELLNYLKTELEKESHRTTKNGKTLKNKSIYNMKKLILEYVENNLNKIDVKNVNTLNYGVIGEIILKGLLFNKYNYKANGVDYKDNTTTYEIKTNCFGNHNLDFNKNEKVENLILWFNDMVYQMNYKEFVNYLQTIESKNIKVNDNIITTHLNYNILKDFRNKKIILTTNDIH